MYTPEGQARIDALILGTEMPPQKPVEVPIPKKVEEADLSELEDPKLLRKLPENYDVVFSNADVAAKMHAFARKLASKHRNWTKERIMRKCFEEFPSTRIRIK